jgi:PPOX class probable F420-dependent enzyme
MAIHRRGVPVNRHSSKDGLPRLGAPRQRGIHPAAMSAGLLEPYRDYLAAPRSAVLSTLDAEGAPQQAVVHYLPTDDGILINGRPDRWWAQNLRRDPRLSIVVHDADQPLHWVGIRGTAELLREDEGAVEDAVTIARRYGEDPTPYETQQRVSFRVLPRRVYEFG